MAVLHLILRLILTNVFVIALLFNLTGCCSKPPKIPISELSDHVQSLGMTPSPQMIYVDSKDQTLTILKDNKIQKVYTISTSKKGLGEKENSFKTPQGLHRIHDKIGDGVPKNGIFHKRHYIGSVWKKLPQSAHRKDFITTRILRLEGLQKGLNKGRNWIGQVVDSERRAVYIHGTTMDWKLGTPSTKGCVHMSPNDVIKLFNEIPVGTLVWIN